MNTKRLRTVALLAREPGLLVLRDALINHPMIDLSAIFTHGLLPKAESGTERSETVQFITLCQAKGLPLILADNKEARNFRDLLPSGSFDLMISLSWRYVVPQETLDIFRYGCINIHRGALPKYPGAKPVQQAIEAGDKRVAITAHEMVGEIDAGQKHAEVWMDIAPIPDGSSAASYAEDVKKALYPLYAPLTLLALQAKITNISQNKTTVAN